MKKSTKLAAIMVLIAVLVGAWIYASPYLTVRAMRKAAEERDAVALADYVNFPALRESLRGNISVQMMKTLRDNQDNPFAALGVVVANSLINPMIDSMVSPEGLAAIMNGRKLNSPTQGNQQATEKHTEGSNDGPVVKMRYERFSRFTVTTYDKNQPPSQAITMIFLRDGLSWKLSALRLPTDDLVAKADLLTIESSAMEADPTQLNIMTLTALIRNLSSSPEPYPNLELTLTDTQGTPIARRILYPENYLSNSADKTGFSPNKDLAVKLRFDTLNLSPSSYKLVLYYPDQKKQPEPTSLPTFLIVK